MTTPPGSPPAKKGMSTLSIVLLILGGLFLTLLGTCAAGLFWLKGKAEGVMSEIQDGGGMVLASPPEVKEALAGPRKDYVGTWTEDGGSELFIDADGNLRWEKRHGGMNQTITAPIAAFAGDDIEVKVMIKVVLKVSRPPHPFGDHWEMTVDGVPLTRK
jgi:hypothetical protein